MSAEEIAYNLIVESMAELSHTQWAGWAEWMMANWEETHTPSGETYQERWTRQIATPYADLSEEEKESDRIEARKMIARMEGLGYRSYADGYIRIQVTE